MQTPFESSNDRYFEELVRSGIIEAKGGNKSLANRILTKATMIKTTDPRPWIWLSATTDDPKEQREYLEKAVAADPTNAMARRGLVMLDQKMKQANLVPEGAGVAPRQPDQPEEAQAKAYQCPKCGGRMSFNVVKQELACEYCGYIQQTEKRLAADEAERSIDYVLPTVEAHRWAEALQRLSCQLCGAITLLPPQVRADTCPYCGSNRLVKAAEDLELIDPQVIALMKIEKEQAKQQVRKWLGKGMFIPDDLLERAGGINLHPAYFPFWSFDGALEIPWSCEVNEGSDDHPRWVPRNGTHSEFFDDMVVPGLRSMTFGELASVEPFNLKDVVEFSPDYLAGWLTLTYDHSLSDASLKARERVIRRIRSSMFMEIEVGRDKRNLRTGAGKWSGLTFKNMLLPLWIGTYLYQGKFFRVLVNGQSGRVGGAKPRDNFKLVMVLVMAAIILAVMAVAIYLILASPGNLF